MVNFEHVIAGWDWWYWENTDTQTGLTVNWLIKKHKGSNRQILF